MLCFQGGLSTPRLTMEFDLNCGARGGGGAFSQMKSLGGGEGKIRSSGVEPLDLIQWLYKNRKRPEYTARIHSLFLAV